MSPLTKNKILFNIFYPENGVMSSRTADIFFQLQEKRPQRRKSVEKRAYI
jgi:hypothetical protein